MKNGPLCKLMTLTATLAFLVFPTVSFAAGTGDNPNFIPDKPSEEQQRAKQEKLRQIEEFAKRLNEKSGKFNINSLGEMKTISVTGFKQETSYWCGPATTKQVLHFLNGSSESQQYYANKLGTTKDGTVFSEIDDLLNKEQSVNRYNYVTYSSGEFIQWKAANIFAIDAGYPVVLDLKITPQTMPKYKNNVEGHILNTSGYDARDDNKLRIRVTDPFDEGGRGDTLGNQWYDMDGVWKANQAHFRKAIII